MFRGGVAWACALARHLPVQLDDEDLSVGVTEVRKEDVALRVRIVGDGGAGQAFHECQHGVGVARLRRPDVHGIERERRRNDRRKPRFGQNRDESRLVSRQSVTIVW